MGEERKKAAASLMSFSRLRNPVYKQKNSATTCVSVITEAKVSNGPWPITLPKVYLKSFYIIFLCFFHHFLEYLYIVIILFRRIK